VAGDEGKVHGDIVADEAAADPGEVLASKDLHAQLDDMLAVLNERERTIIDRRFGLRGLKPMLLEDVGREFGVSRERIRQLQNVALKKMKRVLAEKDKPVPSCFAPKGRAIPF